MFSILLLVALSASGAIGFSLAPMENVLNNKEVIFYQSKVVDCGDDKSVFHLTDARLLPDPMVFPGNSSLSATLKVLQDMPEKDLLMKVTLKKAFPPIDVPCINNFGSW